MSKAASSVAYGDAMSFVARHGHYYIAGMKRTAVLRIIVKIRSACSSSREAFAGFLKVNWLKISEGQARIGWSDTVTQNHLQIEMSTSLVGFKSGSPIVTDLDDVRKISEWVHQPENWIGTPVTALLKHYSDLNPAIPRSISKADGKPSFALLLLHQRSGTLQQQCAAVRKTVAGRFDDFVERVVSRLPEIGNVISRLIYDAANDVAYRMSYVPFSITLKTSATGLVWIS
jgi:hypothetical protein